MAVSRPAILWVPVLAWAAVIFGVGTFHAGIGGALPGGDKFAHILTYGILGILLARAWEGGPWSTKTGVLGLVGRGPIVFAVLTAGLYGIVDEVQQGLIPGRSATALDALADAFGGGVGAWLFGVAEPRHQPASLAEEPLTS